MDSKFKRILNLTRRTGDRIVVFDSDSPEDAYAIMSLDEYEKINDKRSDLKGLTEDEMIDKINRDIALWKNDEEPSEDVDKKEQELLKEDDFEEEKESPKKKWSIPEDRKKSLEEDEIIEEDRQYLEEINY